MVCVVVNFVTTLVKASLSVVVELRLTTPNIRFVGSSGCRVVCGGLVADRNLVVVFFFLVPTLVKNFNGCLMPLLVKTPSVSFPELGGVSL